MNIPKNAFTFGIILLAIAGYHPAQARAATFTWDASGLNAGSPTDGSGTWSTTGTNWSNGSIDAGWNNGDINDNAVFGVGNGAAGAITVGSVSVGNITFNAPGSGSYTLTSGTITLTSGTITTNASSATINSVIAGSVGLTATGAGALTLGGANTYTGTTTVGQGTLVLASTAGPAIPGNITMGTGSITINPTIDTTQPNQFGSGTVISFLNSPSGYERLQLEGNNQTIGGLSDSLGAGVIQNYGYLGATASQSGTLTISLAAGAAYSYTGYIRNYDGAGAGTSGISLVVSGSGEQTLSGADILYTGPTTISSGTLQLTGALGGGSYAGAIADNGALIFNTTQTLTGPISGAGTFTESGGSVTLTASNTFSGTTAVGNGTLTLSSASGSAIAGNVNLGNSTGNSPFIITTQPNQFAPGAAINFTNTGGNPRLEFEGNSQTIAGLTGANSGAVVQNGQVSYTGSSEATATLAVALASGSSYSYAGFMRDTDNGANANTQLRLLISGSGQQTLSGASISYTGPTTVNSGTLALQNATAFASTVTVNSGGALNVIGTAAATYAENTSGSDIINSGGTLNLINNTSGWANRWYFQPTVSGSGTLNVSGGGWVVAVNTTNTIGLTGGINILSGGLGTDGGVASAFGTCTAPLAISSGAYFDLRGDPCQFDALSGSGGVVDSFNSATLTIGAANGSATFGGTIVNGVGSSGATGGGSGQVISLVKAGTGTQIFTGSNGYTGSTTINAGTLQIGNGGTTGSIGSTAISGSSGAALAFNLSSSATESAAISGGLTLVQNGSGMESLNGANTYSGNTTISSGTLQIGGAGALGSSGTYTGSISDNGAFIANSSATQNLGGPITGIGSFTQAGTGNTILSASNSFSGGTTVSQGTLTLSSTVGPAIPGSITFGNGSTSLNPTIITSQASQFAPGAVISFVNGIGGYTRLELEGNVQTVAGLGDSIGAGIVENSGFDGATASQSGTLSIALASGSNYSFSGYIRDTDTGANAKGISLVVTGSGQQTLIGSTIGYTGATTINSGTLALQNTTGFASTPTVNSGGTLLLQSSATTNSSVTGAATTTVNAGGTLILDRTANGTANGGVITDFITGSGTLDINNATSGINGGWVRFVSGDGLSNFTGTVNVNSGVLSMDGVNGAWSGNPELNVVSGGLFALRGQAISVDALTGNGDVFNNYSGANATLTVGAANGSGTFSGIIHGANAGTGDYTLEQGILNLVKSGTGTEILTGVNTYVGTTTISGGTLQIGNGSTGSLANGTAITVSTGTATLAFDEANGASQTQNIADAGTVVGAEGSGIINTLSGAITGTGGFTQSGAGETSLTYLTDYAGYTGPTAVNSGTLAVTNIQSYASGTTTIASGAVFSVNNPSTPTLYSVAKAIFTGSGTLLMNGPGTWSLAYESANAAYIDMSAGGLIDIEGGEMTDNYGENDWASNLGSVKIASGATLDLYDDGGQMDALTGGGTLQNGYTPGGVKTVTIGVSNGSGTFSGVISGTDGNLNVTKAGTGTEILTGSNTYSGATKINAGTLEIGKGGTTGSISSTSGVSGSSGGTLAFDRSDNISRSYPISGGIGVTQAGSGTLTLSGNNLTYTGLTSASAGTLIVAGGISGSVAANGGTLIANSTIGGNGSLSGGVLGGSGFISGNVTVGTGSGAASSSVIEPSADAATAGNTAGNTTLSIEKNLTLNSDAAYNFTLNSNEDGISDKLVVSGTLTLNGAATLAGFDAGNTLLPTNEGIQYIIADASGGIMGAFANAANGSIFQVGQNYFDLSYTTDGFGGEEILLTPTAIPEPGTWASILSGVGILLYVQRTRRRLRSSAS